MAKTYVLDRVAADLARGCTHPAIQRLSSLVAAYPNDLDLRRRLAAAHRSVGNRIQAGRWDYLTIGADRRDTSAFERAFPSAATRLRQVHWPHRAGQAATAYARQRLAKLIAAAADERPSPRATAGPAAVRAAARVAATRAQAVRVAAGTAAARTAAGTATARERVAAGMARWTGTDAARAIRSAAEPWLPRDRSRRRGVVLAVVTAAVVTTPLAVVGLITVTQWFV